MHSPVRYAFASTLLALAPLTLPAAQPPAPSQAQPPARLQAPPQTRLRFDLPAQPLADALRSLGRQSNTNLLFDPPLVKGHRAPALNAELTVAEALSRLLNGTGIKHEFVSERTVLLSADGAPKGADARGAGTLELALVTDQTKKDPAGETGVSATLDSNEAAEVNVKGKRDRTFAVNADIPRTINDVQPYYIFDGATIERSGAANIDEFLKQRLTMNATVMANSEQGGLGDLKGTTSNINLRGLGAQKTLVLVNGRRRPGITGTLSRLEQDQGDLAGIPIGSIDRIEVLPTSASGIYGGSAIGGVINIILKEDYSGGEARVGYENSFGSDNPRRSASLNYGLAVEGGRTHLNFSAGWSDETSMVLNDRVKVFDRYVARILNNAPDFFTASALPGILADNPYLGSLPNIVPRTIGGLLTLHGPDRTSSADDIPLNSGNTFVPAGTSPTTSAAQLRAGLLANAGLINMDNPPTSQSPNGLQSPFGQPLEARSLRFSARRNMTPTWEIYADLMYGENAIRSVYATGAATNVVVAGSYPINPFTTNVTVSIPNAGEMPYINDSTNRSATVGTIVHLPREWMAAFDYTYSDNKSHYVNYGTQDTTVLYQDLASGALNPFVDTLLYPLDLTKYFVPSVFNGGIRLHDFALRGSGPLPALPWGQPRVTLGLEHRIRQALEGLETQNYPLTPTSNTSITTYAKDSTANAAYLEAQVPLAREGALPLLHSLDLQVSGRIERYTQDTGTTSLWSLSFGDFYFGPTTLDGEPFVSETSYTSNNYTVGLKYQPVEDLILRVSRATAFVPPSPDLLTPTPVNPGAMPITVIDSTRPPGSQVTGNVRQLSGGNPDLTPENSESFNAGIIWQPRWKPLAGLRLNAEYYRIDQHDAVTTPLAQYIVDNEDQYPGRVVRDGNGVITQVDARALNLFNSKTDGLDLSLDYGLSTAYGEFSLHAAHTTVLKLMTQYSVTMPAYDGVDFSNDGGAAKHKSNFALDWERGNWRLGWSARYFGSYKQVGAPGSPLALLVPFLTPSPASIVAAQGSPTIPSQIYHDVVMGYDFARSSATGAAAWLSGVHVQLLVKNVLGESPPMDVYRGSYAYFMSGYGDPKGRSYSLGVRKSF